MCAYKPFYFRVPLSLGGPRRQAETGDGPGCHHAVLMEGWLGGRLPNSMHVGTSCEEVGLSNIISLDKLGPLSFMFNRAINTDAIYCTYILVTHTIFCAFCSAGFV